METTTDQVVQAADSADNSTATVLVPPDTQALYRNRIRFDGFFTGQTWQRRAERAVTARISDLPRTGLDPDELRRSPEFSELRAEVGRAVKAAAAQR